MQLLALGPQNYVLDINPQMSFFKPAWQRHTSLATECFGSSEDVAFGATTVFKIPRRGHMLGNVFLEIRLPNLGIPGGRWADGIGYVLMSRAKLVIDEIEVHDHERLWYDLCDKLFMPHSRRQALDVLIGRGRVLATDQGHTVYLPFKFFCCKNHHRTQQFLPLVALGIKSEVSVELTTEALDGCVVLPAGTTIAARPAMRVTLLTDQAFVDKDEQRAAMMRATRLMIDSVQDVDALSYQIDDRGATDVKVASVDMSELNLPVKYFAFVGYDENAATTKRYFEYIDCVERAVLYVNSGERFSSRPGDYFSLVQTYGHAGRCARDNVHFYSFALDASQRQPCGALNFAVVDRPTLRIELKNAEGRALKLKAFAQCVNWLTFENGSAAFVLQT
jgi:hypothetical protein